MDPSENQVRDTAGERRRPSSRPISVPAGPSAGERQAAARIIAEALLEICTWSEPFEIGDSSRLDLDTPVARRLLRVRFLADPRRAGVLCEVASGLDANDEAASRATPEQARAMVARGFSDGLDGDFRKELAFDAPDAATAIAERTLLMLESVFGWSPEKAIAATLTHRRSAAPALVLVGLSRGGLVELLWRHGVEAREDEPSGTMVEAAFGGRLSVFHLCEQVDDSSRYRVINAASRVGRGVGPSATNTFNALTWLGRSWVKDGDAYLEATMRVSGVTEAALHDWLNAWERAVATAANWFRRVARSPGESIALIPSHFTVGFHNLHRIARCHVRPAAEDAAIQAFIEYASSPERASPEPIDAWAFVERFAATSPDDAIPIESRFVSSASVADVLSWLDRIDGVEARISPAGELEISHVVPGGTLRLAPESVLRVALCPDRFALAMILDRGHAIVEVKVGTEDFYFAPDEACIDVEGMELTCAETRALVTWFETKYRLRALEREMAWSGLLGCGGDIAWVRGALVGAERVGLVVLEERQRFERVLEAARRSWRAARASTR